MKLKELIDGLLLGDGTLTKDGKLAVTQREDRINWLYNLQEKFKEFDISSNIYLSGKEGDFIINGKKTHRKQAYRVQTRKNNVFADERERWYPNGKKTIPCDCSISPQSLALWHMGDGINRGRTECPSSISVSYTYRNREGYRSRCGEKT